MKQGKAKRKKIKNEIKKIMSFQNVVNQSVGHLLKFWSDHNGIDKKREWTPDEKNQLIVTKEHEIVSLKTQNQIALSNVEKEWKMKLDEQAQFCQEEKDRLLKDQLASLQNDFDRKLGERESTIQELE